MFGHPQWLFAIDVSTTHAAGVSRRQVQNFTNNLKNVNILELHKHILNHHEKCIRINTNMPGIREIDVNIPESKTNW